MPDLNNWYFFLYCFLYFTLATVYALAVDGRMRHFWVLLLIYLIPLAFRAATHVGRISPQFVMNSVLHLAPDTLFLLGLIFGVFAPGFRATANITPLGETGPTAAASGPCIPWRRFLRTSW